MSARSRSHGSPEELGQGQGLVEERHRGGDARELVAADTEPEQEVGPVDVGELRPFGQLACDEEQLDGLAGVAFLHLRPRLAGEGAHLELGRAGGSDVAAGRREELGRLDVAVRLGQGLGPGQERLDPAAEVGRDPAAEKGRVDTELRREPGDGLGGGARLAPLDLADVLLRESLAGDLGLGQPCRQAQRAQPLAEARGRRGRCRRSQSRDGRRELVVVPSEVCGGVHLCVQSRRFTTPVHSPKGVRSGSQAWDLRVKSSLAQIT